MKKLVLTALVILGFVLVSQAQTTHTIGEQFGGGIVFHVTEGGLHGLIAETKDQGSSTQINAPTLIANPANHSEAGKGFTDWYMPSKEELSLLYKQRTIVKGFVLDGNYWSSTFSGGAGTLVVFQNNGRGVNPNQVHTINKPRGFPGLIRAIRKF